MRRVAFGIITEYDEYESSKICVLRCGARWGPARNDSVGPSPSRPSGRVEPERANRRMDRLRSLVGCVRWADPDHHARTERGPDRAPTGPVAVPACVRVPYVTNTRPAGRAPAVHRCRLQSVSPASLRGSRARAGAACVRGGPTEPRERTRAPRIRSSDVLLTFVCFDSRQIHAPRRAGIRLRDRTDSRRARALSSNGLHQLSVSRVQPYVYYISFSYRWN